MAPKPMASTTKQRHGGGEGDLGASTYQIDHFNLARKPATTHTVKSVSLVAK